MIKDPSDLDVLVAPNLYGLVLVNCACGLGGGSGLYSAGNFSEHYAVFEPATRNVSKDLVGKNTGLTLTVIFHCIFVIGKNVVNPVAMLSAAVEMLEHLGEVKHARLLDEAMQRTVCLDRVLTPDVGGSCGTTEMVDAIIKTMESVERETFQ